MMIYIQFAAAKAIKEICQKMYWVHSACQSLCKSSVPTNCYACVAPSLNRFLFPVSFRGPCCDWRPPGSSERQHWERLEALWAAPGPDQHGNRDHRAWLLPWRPAWDGAPDAGALENEGGKYWLYGWESLSSSWRPHKDRCDPENIGQLWSFPDGINFGRSATVPRKDIWTLLTSLNYITFAKDSHRTFAVDFQRCKKCDLELLSLYCPRYMSVNCKITSVVLFSHVGNICGSFLNSFC